MAPMSSLGRWSLLSLSAKTPDMQLWAAHHVSLAGLVAHLCHAIGTCHHVPLAVLMAHLFHASSTWTLDQGHGSILGAAQC